MCLVQTPVHKAGTPIEGIIVPVRHEQTTVFHKIACAGRISAVKLLLAVALMITKLGYRYAEDVVAVVFSQRQRGEVLVPHGRLVCIGKYVIGVIDQPITHFDTGSVGFQRADRGRGRRDKEKSSQEGRQGLFDGGGKSHGKIVPAGTVLS